MNQMPAVDPAACLRPTFKLKILDPRLGTQFPLPTYATPGSAGMDMRAMIQEPLTLNPGDAVMLPSGMAMQIDETRYAAVIIPRSGLGHKSGVVMSNGTSLIDSDYRAEIGICLFNRGRDPQVIQPGDRVAQMVILPVIQVNWEVVDSLEDTQRGAGGFGSTGRS